MPETPYKNPLISYDFDLLVLAATMGVAVNNGIQEIYGYDNSLGLQAYLGAEGQTYVAQLRRGDVVQYERLLLSKPSTLFGAYGQASLIIFRPRTIPRPTAIVHYTRHNVRTFVVHPIPTLMASVPSSDAPPPGSGNEPHPPTSADNSEQYEGSSVQDNKDLPLYAQMWIRGDQAHAQYNAGGDLEALEVAVQSYRIAMDATEDDNAEKISVIANFGMALHARFKRVGGLHDLEESINLNRIAEALTPDDSPYKPLRLCNLCTSLFSLFKQHGRAEDLEEAIKLGTRADKLVPDNRVEKPALLNSLGNLLSERYKHSGSIDDLKSAIELQTHAVELTSGNRSDDPAWLTSLGISLQWRFDQLGNLEDLEKAITLQRRSVELTPAGHPDKPSRLTNAGSALQTRFLRLGNLEDIDSAVTLQSNAVELTPESHPDKPTLLNNLANSLEIRYDRTGVLNDLETSIAHQTRAAELTADSHTDKPLWLGNLGLKLHTRFEKTGCPDDLNQAITHQTSAVKLTPESHSDKPSWLHNLGSSLLLRFEQVGNAVDLEEAIRCAAHSVELLPENRPHRVQTFRLLGALRWPRYPKAILWSDSGLVAYLWDRVVKPVMDVVCTLVPPSQSQNTLPHVTWCPTGPLAFLPLHAAGIYPKDESPRTQSQTLMDIAVSSYTPTLEALLKPRTQLAQSTPSPRVLVVSQPETPDCQPIPETATEAGIVMSLVDANPLHDADGTVDAVLKGMVTHEWIHLACHGVQSHTDPINSAFILYDGKLTLSTLMSQHIPNADLAVLSACQTATGDEKLSEEAVHLAAGMLNVGYKSVVGTMWSISDRIAPMVMETFYRVMAEQVKAGGELQPAYALHEATKALRNKKDGLTDFLRWVPFVHFGGESQLSPDVYFVAGSASTSFIDDNNNDSCCEYKYGGKVLQVINTRSGTFDDRTLNEMICCFASDRVARTPDQGKKTTRMRGVSFVIEGKGKSQDLEVATLDCIRD
ncbi:CHAT domain-containing protein [Irpex rosettiformis]|uniref:CHAT domain-containing protein n=1 Tax=Irpex rosettiformis TaxID=378272 RepID=A0ACB8U224_9APHY|nr:CHAT domain-containing protein [Irpex rosettiformis]